MLEVLEPEHGAVVGAGSGSAQVYVPNQLKISHYTY